jgi:hypothetical protein
MSDLYQVAESVSIFKVVLWCFYPMAALVLIELLLRAVNDDDDDDFQGGKGIMVGDMKPAYAPSGA